MNNSAIKISGVTKHYGTGEHAVRALHDINFEIAHNEFFTLLGPSGCGKTTLLRTIGGFEEFELGEITLYGEAIKNLPANKRSVNTVFQNYALFPHMSIRDNVGFGLKMLGKSTDEVGKRANEMLSLVKLAEYADRKPAQLSGGQQQRVALARALAPAPKVLLLDEPLSALDLKLRQSMRYELRQIQETLGITFVFVTHDQEEALTMSDRIAVMSHGEIQQIGEPEEIYNNPENVFVADFIGETNLLPVKVVEIQDERVNCSLANGTNISCKKTSHVNVAPGDEAFVSIRPEHIRIVDDFAAQALNGRVEQKIFLGTDVQIIVKLQDGTSLVARMQSTQSQLVKANKNDEVGLAIDEQATRLVQK